MFRLRDWLAIGPVAAVAFGLGVWGFAVCTIASCHVASFSEAVFRSFGLIRGGGSFLPFQAPLQLVIAQILLPVTLLVGGVKLVLLNMRHDLRLVLAYRTRDHVIICGLGETGREFAANLRGGRLDVVAVTLDADSAGALACEREGVPVLKGDASHFQTLSLTGLRRARALLVCCGSDTLNIEVALRARDLFEACGDRSRLLHLVVEVGGSWLQNVLEDHRSATFSSPRTRWTFLDLHTSAAQAVLSAPGFRFALPHFMAQKAPRPSLLLVGFGRQNQELLRQAVRSDWALPGWRVAATILDSAPDTEAQFRANLPDAAQLTETIFHDWCCSTTDGRCWDQIDTVIAAKVPDGVVVALGDDELSLHAAAGLRARLDRAGHPAVPVFVRVRKRASVGRLLASLEAGEGLPDRLTIFGDLKELTQTTILIDDSKEKMARAAHQVYLQHAGPDQVRQGWHELPERVKRDNRRFVDHIGIKLSAVGLRQIGRTGPSLMLSDAEVEAMAVAEHWRWAIEMFLQGIRFGSARNDLLRRHPFLVGWTELPEEERQKTRAMVRAIPAIVAAGGQSVRRNRIIDLTAALGGADQDWSSLDPTEQAVVLFEPGTPASCDHAEAAIADCNAVAVALSPGPAVPQSLGVAMAGRPRLRSGVEGWLSRAELAERVDPAQFASAGAGDLPMPVGACLLF